jgi:serine/threonine protein kinase
VTNIAEAVAAAFGQNDELLKSSTYRGDVMLEAIIPHDFDPARDTLLMDVPFGYGESSGKTLEVKCERFRPGAAVAIPVPRWSEHVSKDAEEAEEVDVDGLDGDEEADRVRRGPLTAGVKQKSRALLETSAHISTHGGLEKNIVKWAEARGCAALECEDLSATMKLKDRSEKSIRRGESECSSASSEDEVDNKINDDESMQSRKDTQPSTQANVALGVDRIGSSQVRIVSPYEFHTSLAAALATNEASKRDSFDSARVETLPCQGSETAAACSVDATRRVNMDTGREGSIDGRRDSIDAIWFTDKQVKSSRNTIVRRTDSALDPRNHLLVETGSTSTAEFRTSIESVANARDIYSKLETEKKKKKRWWSKVAKVFRRELPDRRKHRFSTAGASPVLGIETYTTSGDDTVNPMQTNSRVNTPSRRVPARDGARHPDLRRVSEGIEEARRFEERQAVPMSADVLKGRETLRRTPSSGLAPRSDSLKDLVQRANSSYVPNEAGGRAYHVIACQGLTFDRMTDTLSSSHDGESNANSRRTSRDDFAGPSENRRASEDMPNERVRGGIQLALQFERELTMDGDLFWRSFDDPRAHWTLADAPVETSTSSPQTAVDNRYPNSKHTGINTRSASRPRRNSWRRQGKPVDEKHLPKVTYLDEEPFAVGGFAKVYRGAYTTDVGALAIAVKVIEYECVARECEDRSCITFPSPARTRGNTFGRISPNKNIDRNLEVSRAACREADIIRRLKHPNVVTYLKHHTGVNPMKKMHCRSLNSEKNKKKEKRASVAALDGETRVHEARTYDNEIDLYPASDSDDDARDAKTGTPWYTVIVSEFCMGGSLRTVLRTPMSVSSSKRIGSTAAVKCVVSQIATGMSYLMHLGVIHGDLKASNVLLHPDKGRVSNWCAKIADFGSANLLHPPETFTLMSRVNGTVSHMAPELLKDRRASHASDVYSFAIVLWEIMARGAAAFEGVTPVNIIVAVTRHDLRPLFPRLTFSPVLNLATRCWQADYASRPSFHKIVSEVGEWVVTKDSLCEFRRQVSLDDGGGDSHESDLSSDLPLSTGSIMSMSLHQIDIHERDGGVRGWGAAGLTARDGR